MSIFKAFEYLSRNKLLHSFASKDPKINVFDMEKIKKCSFYLTIQYLQ